MHLLKNNPAQGALDGERAATARSEILGESTGKAPELAQQADSGLNGTQVTAEPAVARAVVMQ